MSKMSSDVINNKVVKPIEKEKEEVLPPQQEIEEENAALPEETIAKFREELIKKAEVKIDDVVVQPPTPHQKMNFSSAQHYAKRNVQPLRASDNIDIGVPSNISAHGVLKIHPNKPVKN